MSQCCYSQTNKTCWLYASSYICSWLGFPAKYFFFLTRNTQYIFSIYFIKVKFHISYLFFIFLPLPFEALTKQVDPNICWDADKMRYFLKLPPCVEQKNSARRCLKVVDEKTPDQSRQLKKDYHSICFQQIFGSSCFVMALSMSNNFYHVMSNLKVNF